MRTRARARARAKTFVFHIESMATLNLSIFWFKKRKRRTKWVINRNSATESCKWGKICPVSLVTLQTYTHRETALFVQLEFQYIPVFTVDGQMTMSRCQRHYQDKQQQQLINSNWKHLNKIIIISIINWLICSAINDSIVLNSARIEEKKMNKENRHISRKRRK